MEAGLVLKDSVSYGNWQMLSEREFSLSFFRFQSECALKQGANANETSKKNFVLNHTYLALNQDWKIGPAALLNCERQSNEKNQQRCRCIMTADSFLWKQNDLIACV